MKVFYRLILFLFTILILLEIGLRCIGYHPFTLPNYSFVSEPKPCYEPRNNLGVSLVPGNFEVTINKGLQFKLIHTIDSLRSTGTTNHEANSIVQFHGCSFTYGTGLNDEETYPHILHQKFADLNIQNHAVPGYGQVQLLNQLKTRPEKFAGTSCIVLNYLSFHDERNSLNANYQEKLNMGYQLTKKRQTAFFEDFTFPYAELNGNQLLLKQKHIQDIYENSFWRNNSALINWIVTFNKTLSVSEKEDTEITKAIFKEINELCSEYSIDLLVTFMDNNKSSFQLKEYCESIDVKTIDISIDWENSNYTNHPFDNHPSSLAHEIFVEKLSKSLNQIRAVYSSKKE